MAEAAILEEVKTDLSKRVDNLKERIFSERPKICTERAFFVTESYRDNEHRPTVIKRARGLAHVLENMSIFILDDEIIVGNQISSPRGVPVFPEMACNWLEEELSSFDERPERFVISKADADLLADAIIPYWKGRSVQDQIYGALPPELNSALDAGVLNLGLHLAKGIGHFLLDYDLILRRGCEGLIADVQERRSALDTARNPGDLDKYHFLSAVEIVYKSVIKFAERFSNLAREMADAEKDLNRKQELMEIGRICEKVPRKPAESFREALQIFWFTQLIPHIDSDGTAISPGRFDLYMWPYLNHDLEQGRLSYSEGQDLVDQLWLKFNQILSLWKAEDVKYFGGFPISQNLIVGGVDGNGNDITNPLSFMCLAATQRLQLPQPALSVRLHKKTPPKFLDAVVDVIATGIGMPALFNDEIIIPSLLQREIPLRDARDYAIIGCVEPGWHGKGGCASNAAYFNLLKCLELTLGDGCDLRLDTRLGPATGRPEDFRSLDDLLAAFKEQLSFWVQRMVAIFNTIETIHIGNVPFPFNSALVSDCLEKAVDYMAGGARYNLNGAQGVGIANVADSLSAIQQLVFIEHQMTLPELIAILKNDFSGREELRQYLKNKIPAYGNDDDGVDNLARRVGQIYCREVEQYVSPRGARYHPGLYPVSANIPLGKDVAASPDGRLASEPLADGIAPSHGADRKGPTAVLLSASKLDQVLASNGTQLNQKFLPSVLMGEGDRIKFTQYLRTFVGLPVMEVQFNVIDRQTLLDAQTRPDSYPNLVVRVAGYSAFFNDLDRSTQDDIIGRTEQVF